MSLLRWVAPTLLVLAIAVPAAGQEYAIDKGSVLLDGTASITSQGGELYENAAGDRGNAILLNPSVLYFVAPGLAVGGDLYVENASQGDISVTTIGVGPTIAYFFGDSDSSVYPFLGATVNYTSLSADGFDASGFGFGLAGGADFMLTESVAITAQLDYSIENLSVDQADEAFTGNTLRVMLGVAAFLF